MAEYSLFPGVYTTIKESTIAIQASPSSIGLMCLFSEKGPDNQLMLLSDPAEYLTTFGSISTRYGQGGHVSANWLSVSNGLYAIRALPDRTNTPSQSYAYENVFGTYDPTKIEMIEASYANLGVVLTENDGNGIQLDFIHFGPKNYGYIKSISLTTPPSSPADGDKYYIPQSNANATPPIPSATGAWAGQEGCVATWIGTSNDWLFDEVAGTSVAKVGSTLSSAINKVACAVLKDGTPEIKWRLYEGDFPANPNTVMDILLSPPSSPKDLDKYLVGKDPTTNKALGDWEGFEGKVATWNASLISWEFETPTKVFISKDYKALMVPPTVGTLSSGDKFIIHPDSTDATWGTHANQIATWDGSAWTYTKMAIDMTPSDADHQAEEVIVRFSNFNQHMIYSIYIPVITEIKWVDDENASFAAYVHRSSQFNDVVNNSRPDLVSTPPDIVAPLFIFHAIGRGAYYNNILLSLKLSRSAEHETSDSEKTMILDIYDTNSGSKLLVDSYEVSLNPEKKDLSGNSLFLPDVVNKYSNIVRCVACKDYLDPTKAKGATYLNKLHQEVNNLFVTYENAHRINSGGVQPAMRYGSDGNLYSANGFVNWKVGKNLLTRAYTGLLENPMAEDPELPYETGVLDREMVLFDVVFDAGYPVEVKNAIEALITSRREDCVGIVDMLDNASPKQAMIARTMAGGAGRNFNTPYIAIYEPFSLIYDKFSGNDIWITPVYHVARAIGITDKNYGVHQAPAGMKRGMCMNIKALRYNLSKTTAYQDQFVTYNINPIIQTRDGFMIFGQSTSYLRPSKLQDLNVVRFVVKMRRDIEMSLRAMLFDLNEPFTWTMIDAAVKQYLGSHCGDNGALESYTCKVYATEYDKTQHRCRVDITIKPKQVIYQILVTITV